MISEENFTKKLSALKYKKLCKEEKSYGQN